MSTPAPEGIVGLVLASGRGQRFDPSGQRNKLLASMPDGRPVLAHSVAHLRAVLDAVAVVVPPHAEAMRSALAHAPVHWVENRDFALGMGHAIARGVAAFSNARGWLVALGDMPYIGHDVLAQLAAALESGSADAVAPVYRGQRGHPVGFAAVHGPALRALTGDAGARTILAAPGLLLIETDDSGILRDIDLPEQLSP